MRLVSKFSLHIISNSFIYIYCHFLHQNATLNTTHNAVSIYSNTQTVSVHNIKNGICQYMLTTTEHIQSWYPVESCSNNLNPKYIWWNHSIENVWVKTSQCHLTVWLVIVFFMLLAFTLKFKVVYKRRSTWTCFDICI